MLALELIKFNFFSDEDQRLFESLPAGSFNLRFQNKYIRSGIKTALRFHGFKRLHTHGLIKKAGRTYKRYLAKLGIQAITFGLQIKELAITP